MNCIYRLMSTAFLLSLILQAPAQAQASWCDDFEAYSSESGWTTNWHGSGNVPGIAVDNAIAYSGSRSLRMFGVLSSCWAAVATRPIEMNLPLEITFMVRNGTESLSGCHPFRGNLVLRTGGPDWWNCPCPSLLTFLPNGDIWLQLSEGSRVYSGFALETWHGIRCRLSLPGDGFLHVRLWANCQDLGETLLPEEPWMTAGPAWLDISAQEGTAWFDDVCVNYPSPVEVDIKPQSCPNPLNVSNPRGLLPVAVLGREDFDVSDIDPTTALLQGVSPLRWHIEDVAGPVIDPQEDCECTADSSDGYADVTMKYNVAEIVDALGEVNNGDVIALTLTGSLYDGTEIEGSDCVWIIVDRGIGAGKGTPGVTPGTFMLGESYPNPFNAQTTIEYALPHVAHVTIEIYDLLGRKVETIVNEHQQAGYHQVTWDSKETPSGVYFYRIEAADFTECKRMTLLK